MESSQNRVLAGVGAAAAAATAVGALAATSASASPLPVPRACAYNFGPNVLQLQFEGSTFNYPVSLHTFPNGLITGFKRDNGWRSTTSFRSPARSPGDTAWITASTTQCGGAAGLARQKSSTSSSSRPPRRRKGNGAENNWAGQQHNGPAFDVIGPSQVTAAD